MNKLKYIRIQNKDGSYGDKIPFYVDGSTVEINGQSLITKINEIDSSLMNKVTKEQGKGLSVNNYTNEEKQKLNNIEKGATNTIIDSTLSKKGTAADASSVGNRINIEKNFLQQAINTQTNYFDTKIMQLQSLVGSPLTAFTVSEMIDYNKIYVYTGSESGYINGNWYYWDGSSWTSGGVYNAVAINIDSVPTQGSGNAVSSGGVWSNAFIAERQVLHSGDDADNLTLAGSYVKPASNNVANLPVQDSGFLIVITRGTVTYQLYLSGAPNGGKLYYRKVGGNWKTVATTVDTEAITDSLDALGASIDSNFFKAFREAMADGADANDKTVTGAYAKLASRTISNIPTQNAGYLCVLTNGSDARQLYVTHNNIYHRTNGRDWHMLTESRLFGKTLIALGDSLIYGQGLSADDRAKYTWTARLASDYGMTTYNYGVSGSSIAKLENGSGGEDAPLSMATRIDGIVTTHASDTVDYFVLEGGANDFNNTPNFGELSRDNLDKTTFYGALNYIVNQVHATWPKARLLLMTNYDRKIRGTTAKNDETYVDAMIAFAKYRSIPVFDNYHTIGVSIKDYANPNYDPSTDPAEDKYLDNWFFPKALGQHLSIDAYEWVTPIYAQALETGGLYASGITVDATPTQGSSNAVSSGGVWSNAFIAERQVLQSGDDANNLTLAGSYVKLASTQVDNLPVQNGGILIVLTRGSVVYQIYQSGAPDGGRLFIRKVGGSWKTIATSDDIDAVSADVDVLDEIIGYGFGIDIMPTWEQGSINTSGNNFSSSSAIRTGFFDTKNAGCYTWETAITNTVLYAFTYDENKSFIERKQINSTQKLFSVDSAYVRFAVAKSTGDNLTPTAGDSITIKEYYSTDRIVSETPNWNISSNISMWESGSINSSGVEFDSSTYIRSSYEYVAKADSVAVSASDIYSIYAFLYDDTKTFISRVSGTVSTDKGFYVDLSQYTNPSYVRFVITKTNITVASGADIALTKQINPEYISRLLDAQIYADSTDGNYFYQVTVNEESVPCALRLPTTYSPIGAKTKVIMLCHGSGSYVTPNGVSDTIRIMTNHFVSNGYATIVCNGIPYDSNAGHPGMSLGCKDAITAYKLAFEYAKANFNLDSKVYMTGASQGGLVALNYLNRYPDDVRCVALEYPVTNLKGQAWDNPWNNDVLSRMADVFGFSGNSYEADKVIGLNPYLNRAFDIGTNHYIVSPVPVHIWHGTADTTVSPEGSQAYVESIRRAGIEAVYHPITDAVHGDTNVWLAYKADALTLFSEF